MGTFADIADMMQTRAENCFFYQLQADITLPCDSTTQHLSG